MNLHTIFQYQDSHVVVSVATLTMYLAIYCHEFGHYLAARFFKRKGMRLLFFPQRAGTSLNGIFGFFRRYAVAAGIDIPYAQIIQLPVWKRRVIFLGGVVMDVGVATIVWMVLPTMEIEEDLAHGIMIGVLIRASFGLLCNLIPNAALKNDGWRFLNPHSET